MGTTNELDNLPMTHRMAQLLLARAGQPNPSWGGALGNALAAGLGGYFEGQDERQKIQGQADVNKLFAPGAGPGVSLPPPTTFSPPQAQAAPVPVAPPQANLAAALMQHGLNQSPEMPPPAAPSAPPTDLPEADSGAPKGPQLTAPGIMPPSSVVANRFGAMAPPTAPPTQTAALPFASDQEPPSQEALARALVTQGGSGLNLNPTEQKVIAAANKYGIPPQELLAIKRNETTGSGAGQVSSAGAIGPMQLMPGTARDLGVDPRNEDQNIDGGARYYAQMRQQFGNNPIQAAAAYNAGPGRVASGGPLPAETQNYVQKFQGQQPSLTLAFNGQPQQAGQAGPPPPPQGPQPQGQIGGFTPEVLKTLRDYAGDGSNPSRAAEAQKYLDHYNALSAGQEWKPIQITPPGAFNPITVLHNQATNEFKGLDGRPVNFGATNAANTVGNQTLTGPAYLSTIPDKGFASTVQGIGDGRLPYPSSFVLKTPYGQALQNALALYRPDMTAQDYQTRLVTEKAFDVGAEGKAVKAANQAISHAAYLNQIVDKLPNVATAPDIINPLIKGYKSQTDQGYQDTLAQLHNTVEALGGELTKAFRGNSGSIRDVEAWQKSMYDTASPATLKGGIQSAMRLLDGAISALGDQYAKGTKSNRDPREFLTPSNRAAFDALSGNNAQPNSGQPQPQAPAPQGGEVRYLNGRAYRRGPNGEAVPVQ